MIVVCRWYHEKKILHEKEPLDDKRESDGICDDCARSFALEMNRAPEDTTRMNP